MWKTQPLLTSEYFHFRHNSGATKNSSPKTHRRINSSSEHSTSSSTHDNLKQRSSTPSISFSVADGVKLDLEAQSLGTGDKGTEPHKSLDGSESQKSENEPPDLREKCFEKSLNTILDKCSETSMDLTLDSRDSKTLEEPSNPVKPSGKSTERKKKSVPWYTVSRITVSRF